MRQTDNGIGSAVTRDRNAYRYNKMMYTHQYANTKRSGWNRLLIAALLSLLVRTITAHLQLRSNQATHRTRNLQQVDQDKPFQSTRTHSAPPVIGILSQPLNETHDYIAASYVKWIEAGGGRSIVIPYGAQADLLDEIWSQINGILLPGGAADIPFAARYVLSKVTGGGNATEYNSRAMQEIEAEQETATDNNTDNGDVDVDVIPVWGTCLGFEFIVQYFGDYMIDKLGRNIKQENALQNGFDAENISLPLLNVRPVELYFHPTIRSIVESQSVTLNNHHQGIEPAHFVHYPGLTDHFYVTSTNVDVQGRPFVSTIEPQDPGRLPIYGVQYHPEKNAFEYATYPHTNIPYEAINHSSDGIQFALYLAQFFVSKVYEFWDKSVDDSGASRHEYTLVDRHPYVYTYPIATGVKFEQVYIIPQAPAWETSPLRI
jgi:gamma-glutamyl hydrolase